MFIFFSFDSGKFSRHDKVRLREAIDNLNSNVDVDADADDADAAKTSLPKRLKTTNMIGSDGSIGVDASVSSSGTQIRRLVFLCLYDVTTNWSKSLRHKRVKSQKPISCLFFMA